jgi:hypothetical protein
VPKALLVHNREKMAFFTHTPSMIPVVNEEANFVGDEQSIVRPSPPSYSTANENQGDALRRPQSPQQSPRPFTNLNSPPFSNSTDINLNPSDPHRGLPQQTSAPEARRRTTTSTSCGKPEKTDYTNEANSGRIPLNREQQTRQVSTTTGTLPTLTESKKGLVGKSRIEYVVHL